MSRILRDPPLIFHHVTATVFSATSAVTLFEEPLTSILTSRVFIDLQRVERIVARRSQSISQESELAFESHASSGTHSFLGSIECQHSIHGHWRRHI
ncbi:hypothetical protein DICSQDRAFT_153498 [Dichomitus squalens LYAD-421 SS1]|uniref:uncharacterized protein n=1 Tax=Dichomitus squalens (strain LYAD-421) TaxID=732165 RepID=UPI00044113CB|nr:uncharacterized protein DICSQDRAFT_153498 [Dichomitus squalens LYAD-421 SS1]EJF63621.1 hypothetical protein DICSQDRAFT_153498 [Dichomitus squalens LYAD-421 SS1]